jgi:hypothetical protein
MTKFQSRPHLAFCGRATLKGPKSRMWLASRGLPTTVLGDSAYPMKHWLIPSVIRNLNNLAQNRFLVSHKRTRRIIEQSFGVLK